jgi:hypothetical protein
VDGQLGEVLKSFDCGGKTGAFSLNFDVVEMTIF